MREMISGGIAMGYFIAGLFFLRFWKRMHDQLFLWFAVSFWILGATRIGLVLTYEKSEGTIFFVFRFIAFLLIIWAILRKNMTSQSAKKGPGPSM